MSETATKANGGTATKARTPTPKLMLSTAGRLKREFNTALEKRTKAGKNMAAEREKWDKADAEILAVGTALSDLHAELAAWIEANPGGKPAGGTRHGAPPG